MVISEKARTIRIALAFVALAAGGFAFFELLHVEVSDPERGLVAFLAALGLLIAIVILYRVGNQPTGWRKAERRPFASKEEKELLVLCGGDKKQAERLINYHAKQIPGSSRRQAASRASDALRSDNR